MAVKLLFLLFPFTPGHKEAPSGCSKAASLKMEESGVIQVLQFGSGWSPAAKWLWRLYRANLTAKFICIDKVGGQTTFPYTIRESRRSNDPYCAVLPQSMLPWRYKQMYKCLW